MPGSIQIGCVDVNTFYWHVYQLAIFKSLQLEILTSGEVTKLEMLQAILQKLLIVDYDEIWEPVFSSPSISRAVLAYLLWITKQSDLFRYYFSVMFSHAFFGCRIWMNCNFKNYEINISAQGGIWLCKILQGSKHPSKQAHPSS